MNATSPATTLARNTDSGTPIVPAKLAHYVIRAKRFEDMLAWYRRVFHLRTTFEAPVIAFLSYDEEHHRIAFLNTAHLPAPDTMRTGIDHVAFTYANLPALLHTWQRLKTDGIEPFWCINHGPTTSMYYRDPDGNEIELQVENFDSLVESTAWFSSPAFAANPIGVDFDPAALHAQFLAGVAIGELLKQGAAPVAAGKAYVFTTLPPPPSSTDAVEACTALVKAYGERADAGDADGFAQLYVEDGVFDRLGQLICGQAAIREVIAGRPPGTWSRHLCSNIRISVDDDGRGASGVVDLDMQRGQAGSEDIQRLHGKYEDRYVLTDRGWRIQSRRVSLVAE